MKMMLLIISLVSMFVCHAVAKDSDLPPPSPRGYPWTINVKVSDLSGSSFFGGLEFDLVFTDFAELNVTLPLQEYVRGETYTFKVLLGSTSQLQYAVVRTIGFCSSSTPLDVLLLDWVQFESAITKSVYMKRLNSAAIKDKCQNVRGTVLIDFEETLAQKCEIDGHMYNSGERFEMDCTAVCTCLNGSVGCVDMCPPFAWLPRPNQKCGEVNLVGKCCPSLACVNQLGQKVAYAGNHSNPNSDTPQCKVKTIEKVQNDFVRGYPSVVFVCDDQCRQKSFTPAVIISSEWVAIYGDENWNETNAYVYVMRSNTRPRRFKVQKAVKSQGHNLILLKVAETMPNSLEVQPVNLPLTKNHCTNLMATTCPLINPNWKVSSGNSVTVDVQLLTLNRGEFVNRNLCNPDLVREHDSQQDATCLALTPEFCGKVKSGPLYVSDGELDFFVGMQSSVDKDDQNIFNCQNRVVVPGVSVCSLLDWIHKTIAFSAN